MSAERRLVSRACECVQRRAVEQRLDRSQPRRPGRERPVGGARRGHAAPPCGQGERIRGRSRRCFPGAGSRGPVGLWRRHHRRGRRAARRRARPPGAGLQPGEPGDTGCLWPLPAHARARDGGRDPRVAEPGRRRLSPRHRHGHEPRGRALGRDRIARGPARHAPVGGLLHPVPLGRSPRSLGRRAAGALPRRRLAPRAAAAAAARGEQRGGPPRPALRARYGPTRRVSVRRRAGRLDPRRPAIIVLDGLGIGAVPDQAAYGDAGSDTLGNVARAVGGLKLPNLERLGLGRCRAIPGLAPGVSPRAAYGVALPRSPGKDSTTGHWEICGVILERPFRTYPHGFPTALLDEFARRTGRGWLGNKAASGTAIIAELGAEHQRTGAWIVYTSADSVFQVAAHEDTVPLQELYGACEVAREMLIGEHAVSRVIARPFVGDGGGAGEYRRSPHRRAFSPEPVGTTLLD